MRDIYWSERRERFICRESDFLFSTTIVEFSAEPPRPSFLCPTRPHVRIHDFPSDPSDPTIPEFFHPAKNWIFKALEEDAFVRFLRAKAFSNLTKMTGLICLGLGLLSLWAGFVVAFSLVFLDEARRKRLWVSAGGRFAYFLPSQLTHPCDPDLWDFATALDPLLFRILFSLHFVLLPFPVTRLI